MGFLGNLMNGLSGAATGFMEGYFQGDPSRRAGTGAGNGDDYGSIAKRQARYELHWKMYHNTVYRDLAKSVRTLAQEYKAEYALYRHIRGVYSPSKRIADFFRMYLHGGSLDPSAGDGKEVQTAIPIEGANESLRQAIARLWWDSNWETRKGVYNLWGTVLGDVMIEAVDSPQLGIVTLELVHPGIIAYLEKDAAGEVLAYQKRQMRPDPLTPRPEVRKGGYQVVAEVEFWEEASIENGKVVYRTYRDRALFDWRLGPNGMPIGTGPGARPEWVAPYEFIPLYHVQHIDEGMGWGCSELEGGRTKIDGVNDLGSKLHDQVRRMVEGAWLFTGMQAPDMTPTGKRTPQSVRNPEPARQEQKVIYEANPDAKAHSLVSDLDIASVTLEIRQTLDSLEDDYPELRFERLRLGGTVSGEALRVAQQPAAARVQERRAAYDYALMCAQMAAVAIGGDAGYDGYQGFGLADYSVRKPNHRIGRREVFATSPADMIAEKTARFAAIKMAADAGVALPIAMKDLGYSDEDVNEAVKQKDAADKQAMADQHSLIAAKTPDKPPKDDGM